MRTLFFVQPYRMKHQRLVAGGAMTFEDEDAATLAGRRAARFRSGVVVLAQDVDGRTGFMSKPRVIAIHGRVPDPWRAADLRRDAA